MGAKRTRRSPEEILAEKRAALERAEERAAMQAAKDHPASAAILEEIGNINKALSLARRGFVKGRQNFENRIKSHQMWISEIEAERNYAYVQISHLEEIRDNLSDKLTATVSEIRDGGDPTLHDAVASIEECENSADAVYNDRLSSLESEYFEAKAQRQEFTDSLKSSKDEDEGEAPENVATA